MTASSSRKQLGLWRTTSLVLGNIVGTSILMMPAVLAKFGSASLLGWLITAAGAIFLSLMFGRLAQRIPKAGGPYAYCRSALGDFVGFQMAWSYWIANWVSNAAVAVAFVNFLGAFFPILHTHPQLSFLVAIGSVWSITLLNCVSLKSVGAFQVVATVLKILPLAVIGIAGAAYVKFENFMPFLSEGISLKHAITSSAALTLFSFVGLESATIPADNVKQPGKTIPRATVLGTCLAALLYLWVTLVCFGVLSTEGAANSFSPFAEIGKLIFGELGGTIIAISAAFSCFATLNGWILLQGQVPMAAAHDHLFPAIFKKTTKAGIPVFGLVFSSLLITIMLAMNYEVGLVEQFTFIVNLTSFTILITYLYAASVDLLVILQEGEVLRNARFWKNVLTSSLALMYTLWTITGAGHEVVYLGAVFIFFSVPVYSWMLRKKPMTLGGSGVQQ